MTDKRTLDLDPNSKHSPERTEKLTAALAQIMRVLNYATDRNDHPAGLGFPLSPQDPLHDLARAAESGAQLYEQYGQALHSQAADFFTLRGDERGPVEKVLGTVDAHLVKAVALSTALGEELNAAFNAAAALYVRDPEEQQ
jgi:hypothetical protein